MIASCCTVKDGVVAPVGIEPTTSLLDRARAVGTSKRGVLAPRRRTDIDRRSSDGSAIPAQHNASERRVCDVTSRFGGIEPHGADGRICTLTGPGLKRLPLLVGLR